MVQLDNIKSLSSLAFGTSALPAYCSIITAGFDFTAADQSNSLPTKDLQNSKGSAIQSLLPIRRLFLTSSQLNPLVRASIISAPRCIITQSEQKEGERSLNWINLFALWLIIDFSNYSIREM